MKKTILLLFLSYLSFAQCHPGDVGVLTSFYNTTNGSSWFNDDGWDKILNFFNQPGSNPCSYAGVTGISAEIVGGFYRVTKINLQQNNLTGSLPTTLGGLTQLKEIRLQNNNLGGSIPSSIGDLSNLTTIELYNNDLTGSIPSSIGGVLTLTKLSLQLNHLTGSIPSSFENLSNLKYLLLYNNELEGPLPDIFDGLTSLEQFNAQSNQISGTIPPSLGSLPAINQLQLGNNELEGCFDANLSSLCALRGTIRWNIFPGNTDLINPFEQFCDTGLGECICPTMILLESTVDDIASGTEIYEAHQSTGYITASNQIGTTADVRYAASHIHLNPGFSTETGAVFKAETGGCN
ncbi:3-coathanger stack domain-containing protein [Jiulongibacter sp. NS-SX5]|uniref:3-coathanger stack domain-containing protein n=1 Tax=Jiulongibacter sp. NS-SX5 TaxID=3463854 RepID=UPI004057DE4E